MRRILHVTEASAAGVLTAVSSLVAAQIGSGHAVAVVFLTRPDSPSGDELRDFVIGAECVIVERSASRLGSLGLLTASSAELAGRFAPDIVHVHSSWAGVALRGDPRFFLRWRNRLVYSPHGWAFLRGSSWWRKTALRFAEMCLLQGGSGVIAVSDSERALSPGRGRRASTRVVENSLSPFPPAAYGQRNISQPIVVSSGRIVDQKAPWRFREMADAFADSNAKFVWVGDGPSSDRRKWLNSAAVEVTGWVSAAQARSELAQASVFVLLSRWEGLPMAAMEAQAMGIPVVASDVVGNRDVVIDGVTGFLCGSVSEACDRVRRLLDNAEQREAMSTAARANALERWTANSQAQSCDMAYADLVRSAPNTVSVS